MEDDDTIEPLFDNHKGSMDDKTWSEMDVKRMTRTSNTFESIKSSPRSSLLYKSDMRGFGSARASLERKEMILNDNDRQLRLQLEEMFVKAPCLYTHRIFLFASKVLADIIRSCTDKQPPSTSDTTDDPCQTSAASENHWSSTGTSSRSTDGEKSSVDASGSKKTVFRSASEKTKCLQLAISTYKYFDVILAVLESSSFFGNNPYLKEASALTYVILYDFMNRKFQKRCLKEDEELNDNCSQIEAALLRNTIDLQACFARIRIKHGARLKEILLPICYREIDETAALSPCWIWVNQLKMTVEEGVLQLSILGLCEDETADKTQSPRPGTFYRDSHCNDVVVINKCNRNSVKLSSMYTNGCIIFHDKSQSLAITAFLSNVTVDDNVAVVNPLSLLFVLHLESQLWAKFSKQFFEGRRPIHVFFDKQRCNGSLKEYGKIKEMGSKGMQLHIGNFTLVNPRDERWCGISCALFMTTNTMSGIIDPIEYMSIEPTANQRMIDNCFDMKTTRRRPSYMLDYVQKSISFLRLILQFSQMRLCVVLSNSIFNEENEEVLHTSIEQANKLMKTADEKSSFTVCEFPAIFQWTQNVHVKQDGSAAKIVPSVEGNGAFIAVIHKPLIGGPSSVCIKGRRSEYDVGRK